MLFIESEYKKIEETTDKYKKQKYWKIAVGLNQVDDLKPSEELRKLAYDNINNIKTYIEVEDELHKYYSKSDKINKSEYECDMVSLKIVRLLDDRSFNLTVNELKNIHRELFENVIKERYLGSFRDYNIKKFEDILSGDSAIYGNFQTIEQDLNDVVKSLNQKKYSVEKINDIIELSMECIINIWNIHPFIEGNTRTSTVFMLKFLDSSGIENISNDLFKENSKYFRDCLVLSNYSELNKYNEFIRPNRKPLQRFLEKLLVDEKLDLLEIEPVHNNSYYNKIENPSKLMEYEELNEKLDLGW